MKKIILLLAATVATLSAQTIVGTPHQATITIVGVDPTSGANCSPGGAVQVNLYGGRIWQCTGPIGTVVTGGAASPSFTAYTWARLNGGSQPYNPTTLTGATIVLTGYDNNFFNGTTALVTMTPQTGISDGTTVTLTFTGSGSGLTWTAAGNIAAAGTATTTGTSVTFRWSAANTKWYPSRVS